MEKLPCVMPRLVAINELSELSGIPIRSLRTLLQKKILPCYKTGHRSLLFDPRKCAQALERFEVKSAFEKKGR